MKILVRTSVFVLLAGTFSAVVGAMISHAANAGTEPLKVGEPMPDFALKDTTGKEHTLDQYEGQIVVFNFCSQTCPFSRGADPSINELAKTYGEKGVVFIGVDSNKDYGPEEIQGYIEKADIPYPILKDVGNKLADAVGARVTPEIYIKDKDGTVVYHGAPDNRTGPKSTPTEHYLKDALEALVAGEPIETTFVKAWGCTIKRAN